MQRIALRAAAALAALAAAGCPRSSTPRWYPEPTVTDLLTRIASTRDQVSSFTAETVMDYWLGDQRVKAEVLVMGAAGSKIRINALSPAGSDVIADLACDGTNYAYTDKQKNCQLSGVCSRDTIAALFQIALAPDDFVQLTVGATPLVPGATGTVRWDGKDRVEVLELVGRDGRSQTIVLDAADGRADVKSSEVRSPDGKREWRIDNTDFHTVKDARGIPRRVPGKSRFRSPGRNADLLVDWKQQSLGVALDDSKFQLATTAGLPRCQ